MSEIGGYLNAFLYNYRLLSLFPSCAVGMDYALTFCLAGSSEMILQYEFSPLVRFAAANDLYFQYLLFMMAMYYVVSYAALRILSRSEFYEVGVAILIVVALTHIMGGLSWLVRDPLYSSVVHGLSIAAFILALSAFIYSVIRGRLPVCNGNTRD
jgi:succinate dehydrogenase hydrophobic anchor subunit